MIQFVMDNALVIVVALLAISELLGLIPSVKANSVFQLVVGALKKVKDLVIKPKVV